MIHDVEQNSEQWMELRRGKLTASEAGEWLIDTPRLTLNKDQIMNVLEEHKVTYKKSAKVGELAEMLPCRVVSQNTEYSKKSSEARQNAMCRMISKELGSVTASFMGNIYTDFGHSFEDEAVRDFELRTGLKCVKVGFVTIEGLAHVGMSPDRYVYDSDHDFLGVLEIKCKPEAHAKILIQGVLPAEHKIQVHFQMAISGADKAYFYAYSPDMKSLLVEVYRDEYTENLETALILFNAEYEAFRSENLPKLIEGRELA